MAADRNLTSNAPRFNINTPDYDDASQDNISRNPFADDGELSSHSSTSPNQGYDFQQPQLQRVANANLESYGNTFLSHGDTTLMAEVPTYS